MFNKISRNSLGMILVGLSGFSNASELGFIGAAGLQFKQLKMEQTFEGVTETIPGGNKGDLSASLPVMNLQLISFYEAFYAIAKVEVSLQEADADSSVPFTKGDTTLDTGVKREDYSLILGYKINDLLSVFGGYMAGKTTLTPGHCVGCSNLSSFMMDEGVGEYQQEYKENGLFSGISIGWNVGPGRVGTSFAYALMDGKYSDNFRDYFDTYEFDYEGDSKGLSVSVSWAAPISETLFYFVDARIQQYSMDAEDQTGLAPFDNSSVKTDETLYGLAGGVQMLF